VTAVKVEQARCRLARADNRGMHRALTHRRGLLLAAMCALAVTLPILPSTAVAQGPSTTDATCTADDFATAVDAAGNRLRTFNENALPRIAKPHPAVEDA
jgi:hypothetical protein